MTESISRPVAPDPRPATLAGPVGPAAAFQPRTPVRAPDTQASEAAGVSMPPQVLGRSPFLPKPPTDRQNALYLGPQWRWVVPLSFAGYLLIVVSVGFFVLRPPSMFLFLLPLAVSGLGTTISP